MELVKPKKRRRAFETARGQDQPGTRTWRSATACRRNLPDRAIGRSDSGDGRRRPATLR